MDKVNDKMKLQIAIELLLSHSVFETKEEAVKAINRIAKIKNQNNG